MTKTAKEILTEVLKAGATYGRDGRYFAGASDIDQALKELEAIIRTEKLKLLAEVRERVVGEGELHVSHMCPQDNIHCAKFSQRCQTRNHQNAELTKLEAEL